MTTANGKTSGLIRRNGDMVVSGFTLLTTGITVPKKATEDDWHTAWEFVRRCEGSIMWWIGDLLNVAESRWGETYTRAMEESGYALQTLKNAKSVASNVLSEVRNPELSFAHHMQVAPLTPAQQSRWLDK